MKNNDMKTCRTKDCTNEVLAGKYCEYCKQARKEKRLKVFGVAMAFGGGAFVAIRGGVIKKGVAGAVKAIQFVKGLR